MMSSTASFLDALGMVERQPVRHARAAIVAGDRKRSSRVLHHLDLSCAIARLE